MRKAFKATLAIGLGLAVAVAGLEAGLRFLLFADSGLARRLGASWRNAEWYADPRGDDAYWKLQHLFLDPAARTPVPGPDPVCGWTGEIALGPDEIPDATALRGRRPVLLYGDSYARCTTSTSHCFPALLEQSALGDRFCMINLGVGGYGLDQILLLLRATIDRWKELDPIVVASFLVDDDFHRTTLAFRGWPKPRFAVKDGRLVLAGPRLGEPEAFLAENPVGIRSYLGRLLVFRAGFLPESLRNRLRRSFDRRTEQIDLGRRILEEIHAELASRRLTHFFLAFHGWDSLQPSPVSRWADELAVETAARLGVPLVGTRPYLLAAVGGDVSIAGPRLFEVRNAKFGHYNDLGNWVVFEAIRRGIEGRFDSDDPPPPVRGLERFMADAPADASAREVDAILLGSPARVRLLGESALARISDVAYAPFPKGSAEYLLLRPGEGGPTRVRIAIPEGALRLRGMAIAVVREASPTSAPGLSLTVALDGRDVLSVEPPAFPAGTDVDLALEGAREVELVASSTGTFTSASWIHFAGARFAWKP